ncbi:MAG: CehA/McbA family metallohydrolase [Candidatus Firestonebacteria bacterium]
MQIKLDRKLVRIINNIIAKPKDTKKYIHYLNKTIILQKNIMHKRIDESLRLIKTKICRGDFHIHSTYSDGIGSVAEIKQYVDVSGLDFAFVTDHSTIRQKRDCEKFKNIWWGQEPGSGFHHLGIIGLKNTFKPTGDFVKDYKKIENLGGFAFIPHPTGWFPSERYTDKQINSLNNLGNKFIMEIVNGANNIFDCYDITDEMSIKLWDKFLSQGKEVIALGNSDAHSSQSIGDIWNGVVCNRLNKKDIINAVKNGKAFVSDAPVIVLKSGKYLMGDKIYLKNKNKIKINLTCVDSFGLSLVWLIKNGRIFKEYKLNDEKVFKININDKFNGLNSYYRAECFSKDFRKAWTNPLYIRKKE